MKLRGPQLLIVVFSLIGVLGAALVDLGRTAPGELASVHERHPDLAGGGNDCAMCHGNWFESMGDACLECHGDIAEHIELDKGMHGRLAAVEVNRCGTCHSEHHGDSFAMVNARTFSHAGVADVSKFDHGLVDFEMAGKHLELDCTECHEHAETPVLPEGARRFIGLSSDCASCHEDPHEGSMRQACDNCHSQTGFEERHYDRHEEFFPLFGSHAEAACLDCHEPGSAHSLAAQMADETPDGERECRTCHESPHREPFLKGNAKRERLPQDSSCAACHDPESHSFAGDLQGMSAIQHAFSGFSIDAPHDQLECADCHQPEPQDFLERFPGRGADDCASCHESPHGAQFVGDGDSNDSCIECHDRQHFTPHAFGAERHARAAIELSGEHGRIECNECHQVPAPNEPRVFRGTPNLCQNCHSDAHEDFFSSMKEELSRGHGGECATCHSTEDFHELPAPGFDHAHWTGFPIQGSHAQNRCESCHKRSPQADRHGRSFGRIAEHFGAVQDCTSCHDNPHGDSFDGAAQPREIDGRASCSRCHDETSFRTMPFGFDHALWTGFELRGKHAETSCSTCHPATAQDRLAQARSDEWPTAKGTRCADCHDDPHAGQFRVENEIDCARCHKDSAPFSELRFRHNWDSRFALDETHSSLACDACHKPAQVAGLTVTRFRPLGTECADCHGVNQDVLRRREKRK